MSQMTQFGVDVDIGGTFTEALVVADDGEFCRPSDIPYNNVTVEGKAELP